MNADSRERASERLNRHGDLIIDTSTTEETVWLDVPLPDPSGPGTGVRNRSGPDESADDAPASDAPKSVDLRNAGGSSDETAPLEPRPDCFFVRVFLVIKPTAIPVPYYGASAPTPTPTPEFRPTVVSLKDRTVAAYGDSAPFVLYKTNGSDTPPDSCDRLSSEDTHDASDLATDATKVTAET